MTYRVTCHCGSIELAVADLDLSEVRRCDCSLCRRKGAAMVSAMVGDVRVVKGGDLLGLYQFNTQTAKHYFCSRCGIYTHHQRRSNPAEMGINVGCIDGLPERFAQGAQWMDGVNHPSDRAAQSRE